MKILKGVFIDALANDPDIIKWQQDWHFKYDFVNILKYCKLHYDLPVAKLAVLLGVTRQTIYNYFDIKTEDLPDQIIDKIVQIYHANTLEEVYRKEKDSELQLLRTVPKGQPLSKDDRVFVDDREMPNKSRINKEWQVFLATGSSDFISRSDARNVDAIIPAAARFIKTNSSSYNELLFGLLTQRVAPDDYDFLAYVSKYQAAHMQPPLSQTSAQKKGLSGPKSKTLVDFFLNNLTDDERSDFVDALESIKKGSDKS